MKSQKFIPSQRILGSNKELFIIKYEGSVIEIHRTNNLYEPLVVQINGKEVETIPSKQNKEIIFSTDDSEKHKLEVWNERINNSPLIKAIGKDGIAIVIDGIPVQNTLADPLMGLSKPKVFLWLLTAFLFFISIILPIIQIQNGFEIKLSIVLYAYFLLLILSIYAVLTFQKNPSRSLWMGIIISASELIYYGVYFISDSDFRILSIAFLILRLIILSSLIISLKTIKSFLDVDENVINENKSSEVKTVSANKKKIFTSKNGLIATTIIGVAVGLYFGVIALLSYMNAPSLDRDNSIEYRTDLKLPEFIPYRKGDKWGYCDKDKNIIIPSIYGAVKIIDSKDSILVVNFNGLYGAIDRTGNKITGFKFEQIEYQNDLKRFIIRMGDKSGVTNITGKVIIPFEYNSLTPWGNYYIAENKFSDISLFGLIAANGDIIIDCKYATLYPMPPFNENKNLLIAGTLKYLYTDDRRGLSPLFCGVINTEEKVILPLEYEIFEKVLMYIPLNNIGYIRGNEEAKLVKIEKIDNDYPLSSRNVGVVDLRGNIVIPCEYDDIEISEKTSDFIAVKNSNEWGIITNINEILIPFRYKSIDIWKSKGSIYFTAEKYGYKGVLNEDSEVMIPFEYSRIYNIENESNTLSASKGIKYGMIDMNNKVIIQVQYTEPLKYSEGLAKVQKYKNDELNSIIKSHDVVNSKFISDINNFIVFGEMNSWDANKYSELFNLSEEEKYQLLRSSELREKFYSEYKSIIKYNTYEGFVLDVVLGWDGPWNRERKKLFSSWGYINKKGELKIDLIYDEARDFENGFAEVCYKDKWGLINTNGQVIIPIKYDKINRSSEDKFDLFEVKFNGKKGYVDLNGVEYFEE